jgi:quinol monooxygenase YgiN
MNPLMALEILVLRRLAARLANVIIALGDVYAQVSRREHVRELMRDTQDSARAEPGCLYYEFAETLDDPGHFVVVQRWRDRAALDAHYRSAAFADYQARVSELLVRDSALSLHGVAESVDLQPSVPLDPKQDD